MRPLLPRTRLLHGASLMCVALLGSVPARAQSFGSQLAVPSLPANSIPKPGVTANLGSVSLVRDPASAAARQAAVQQRLANSLGLVSQVQAAARTAGAAMASSVPNGLVKGGLMPASNLVPVAQDPSGLHTLQGALAPVQSGSAAAPTVTVTQTDSRAIVTWDTFNVGRDTTLVFDQKVGGVAQKDWVVFNRVVGQIDPATGRRDPSLAPAPSQILGHMTADATVIVVNPNGVFFGPNSQVRAGSLLVATLDGGSIPSDTIARTAGDRNRQFLAGRGIIFLEPAGIAVPDPSNPGRNSVSPETSVEGDIQVAAGADLTVGDAGTLLLAAPHVSNAGSLTASNGSVLLAGGRRVSIGASTGASGTGGDPDIRGNYIVTADLPSGVADVGAYILNTGIISSPRGYIGLRSDTGAILQQGVLSSTTSVSRNGFIDLGARDVQLAPGSTIAITPDANGETIPQSPDSVAAFKTSRVRLNGGGGNTARVEIAADALVYAPGGRVEAGGLGAGARVFVDNGATIDVGGVKNVVVPATRNQIVISPAKRNELRDTPNYREAFLNGATIYVDPRRSGVRADGVAWVGSPLIEAESYFQQVGITSAELLTKGGSVAFTAQTDVIVKPGATIDLSGGYVRYAAGQVQTSQLITRSGQIVDIGNADPNGDYVGLVNPFTTVNTRFGITDKFPNGTLQGVTQASEYIEGRDAGALSIAAPSIALDGTVYGQAYAGALQRGNAVRGTGTSIIAGDLRAVQAVPSQFPVGAMLAINPMAGTVAGDILVTTPGAITPLPAGVGYGQSVSLSLMGTLVRLARDPASLLPTARLQTIELGDATLSTMGLGQLTLNTTGELTVAAGTVVTLAPGGAFSTTDGRRVTIDGAISAPSGTIAIATYNASGDAIGATSPRSGSAFNLGLPKATDFDVTVNGTLSTRGRLVNDFGLAPDLADGGGYTQGGAITIFAAPRVFTLISAPANSSTDISGSILINPGALVDVSGGAYVGATGTLNTSARGGDLALYEDTTYAQIRQDLSNPVLGNLPGLRIVLAGGPGVPDGALGKSAPNPTAITARVTIAPGSVRAAGFAGGGTFTLSTPAFDFGTGTAAVGTTLPIDFLSSTGFANATINVFRTALFANRFTNGLGGTNAVLDTNTIAIAAGQTLDLTQSRFSPVLSADQIAALRATYTGDSLYAILTPGISAQPYDRLGIGLNLTGLIELDVAAGGSIVGGPSASIVTAKLLDEGTIMLPGGTITASERIANIDVNNGLGVRTLADAFATRANGDIVETDPNAAGIRNSFSQILSNRDLAITRAIYLLGRLGANEGIRVAGAGTIDLAGVSLRNPRAVGPNGAAVIDGRLLGGGTLQTTPALRDAGGLFHPGYLSSLGAFNDPIVSAIAGQTLNALPGATIDLRGASDSFARPDATGAYVPTPEWSNGGTLGLRAGGTIAGAVVKAAGGDPQATGGTLIVRDLRLSQTDPATAGTGAISANQIAASGFDTVVAEGSLGTLGAVDLSLRRAFIVQSAPYDGVTANAEGRFGVTIGATGTLNIAAPIIRLISIAQSVPDIMLGTPSTAKVSFTANALDVQGAVLFDRSVGSATLTSATDLRFVGVQPIDISIGNTSVSPAASLRGQLATSGDLTLAAAQIYPTTGTTFTVTSAAPAGTIRLTRTTAAMPGTPYSAGSTLTIQAAMIEQGGVLRAPLGTLTLGAIAPLTNALGQTIAPATTTLHLAAGSTTSVSADGLSIPYGITTDQVEYFFTPTTSTELTAPPAAVLRLGGANIALDSGATVDLKGGGDVYAYEFVPGIGGSRDLLSRFNADPYSSKTGFQYPDGRQVYAIVPSLQSAGLSPIDPIYSADYAALGNASQVGRRVYLDASPGLAAGWYTLLPAQYALLPGGLRVVEQPEYGTTIPGASTQLLDGTTVVGGYFGVAGTKLRDSERRTFAVQTQPTFRKFSSIATTSADTTFPARAARNGLTSPRIPLDAGRLVIDAITGIGANATFATDAAPGGRASTADIRGSNFLIVGTATGTAPAGTIEITAATLRQLNAASLLIGATRTDNADGTTSLDITGQTITIANDASTALTAPELLFAVDGSGSSIRFVNGAAVSATGAVGDTRTGDYLIAGSAAGQTGAGALVRLSTGPERLVTRSNVQGVAVAPLLEVGTEPTVAPPALAANAILLDSSGDLRVASPASGNANITAKALAIGAGSIAFTADPVTSGLRITPQIQAAFATAGTLNLRSRAALSFAPGSYGFGALTLDAPTLALLGSGGAVTLNTAALRLANSSAQSLACAPACETGTLAVNASSISFGSGQVRATGFGGGVAFAATGGVFFDGGDNTNAAANNGLAGFDAGTGPFALATPFLGDRAVALTPGQSALLPRLALGTTGRLTLTGNGPEPVVAGTPGARLSLSGSDISIIDTQVVATAGTLDVTAAGSITVGGTAKLATPGYARIFGDAADPVVQYAPGGLLRITAGTGNIALGANTMVSVGGGAGQSGELRLTAANGTVTAAGAIDAKTPGGGGAFALLTRGMFDLGVFAVNSAAGFDRAIAIRTGAGDLALVAGQTLRSGLVGLTADNGTVAIAGTIDTSGVNGGDLALFGGAGITLAPTGRLVARATGYAATDSRQASGGAVTIGTDGNGTISLASGSTIDVSAARPGDRLVTDMRGGTTYYRLALSDRGGTVAIRAPLLADSSVAVTAAGTVSGSRDTSVEAFRRFDLAGIAASSGFTGVTMDGNGVAVLDPGAAGANFLSGTAPDGSALAGTIPDLVQHFKLTTSAASLAGLGTWVARPGIELANAGGIRLASNWNLGAGTVDIAAAAAAGDMAQNPAVPGQFYVIPGREADLFQRFTTLLYRVNGKSTGEAGVLSLRAGGTLDIAAGITDGFFAFRDQTTPDAISYAYGGGVRAVQPIVSPDCLYGDCSVVQPFDPNGSFSASNAVTIDLGKLGAGASLLIPAAYNPAANMASPVSGDPLGTADPFPRLATANGTSAAASWSYRLVGGADLTARSGAPSANPLATGTDPAAGVIVRGETNYAVAPQPGTQTFAGALLGANIARSFIPGSYSNATSDFTTFATDFAANNLSIDTSAATIITLAGPKGSGDSIGKFLSDRAGTFFAPNQAIFGTDPGTGNVTVTTTLALAGQFFQSIATDYAARAAQVSGYAPDSIPTPVLSTNFVRTRVRTGTGSIAVAAAGDIDTTNGAVVTRGASSSPNVPLQVGGTAIYTAGALADLSPRAVADASGVVHLVTPLATAPSAFAAAGTFSYTNPFQPIDDALASDPVYLADGGAVSLVAGGNITGRRDVQGGYRQTAGTVQGFVGELGAPYRFGSVSPTTDLRVNAQLFQTGVATLGGGAVRISAGGDVYDMTVVENTSVTTATVTGAGARDTLALVTTGGGRVDVSAGRDVVSGIVDVGAGSADIRASRDVTSTGSITVLTGQQAILASNALRVRVTDAIIALSAQGSAAVSGVFAFGPNVNFYTPTSGFSSVSNGRFGFDYIDYGSDIGLFPPFNYQAILPGSLEVASTGGDIDLFPDRRYQAFMTPSATGQLSLLAGGNLRPVAINMDDGDPGLLAGYFSQVIGNGAAQPGVRQFSFPAVLSNTTDAQRRLLHNSSPTHAGDSWPVRIAAGGDVDTLRLNTPKLTRVYAGRDVLNSAVFAQNLAASDVSRIAAGRDVIATNAIGQRFSDSTNSYTGAALPLAQGNVFVIGGPGTFFVEAGRDAGPFLTSVTATASGGAGTQTLGGGVLSVGNDWNPWLQPVGASVVVQFGTAKGFNYTGLRDIYVDPANVAKLPDELFAQNVDQFGRSVADRTQPIYAPVLLAWAQANAPAELRAAYGTTDVTVAQAYAVFKALPELRQRQFLIEQVYFNELRQNSLPTSVSYGKPSRGYRAVDTLFPATLGYTDNFPLHTLDAKSDPTRLQFASDGYVKQTDRVLYDKIVAMGLSTVARAAAFDAIVDPVYFAKTGRHLSVETGNLDLRLATIQTSRGGNIDILGPGGRVLGGSTVRTSAQAARRLTIAERVYDGFTTLGLSNFDSTQPQPRIAAITTIPSGLEGFLTLRGGAINGFVDRNFLLNQSRLFTQAGGDIALWSSNGDLNAGQGPKTSANFPPVVVRVGPSGNVEVDAVGGVTGAGIAAFQPVPGVTAPNVYLIAPRGTVDAGDAGVRVAGNLFVAALSVANADNFSVGGTAFGIPSGPVVNASAAAASSSATAAASQAANAASSDAGRRRIDPLSRIFVDVLGYYGGPDPCNATPRPANCPATR